MERELHSCKQVHILLRLDILYELHDYLRVGVRTEMHTL